MGVNGRATEQEVFDPEETWEEVPMGPGHAPSVNPIRRNPDVAPGSPDELQRDPMLVTVKYPERPV